MITVNKEDNSFNVSSKRIPGKIYNVAFDKHKELFMCECMHFSLYPYVEDNPCNHIERVITYCKIKYKRMEKEKNELQTV